MKVKFHSFLKGVLLFVMTMMAGTALAEVDYLIVNLVDGTNVSFALADDPKVSVTNNALTVETSAQTITVPFEDLENYKFYDSSAGIEQATITNRYHMENGIITFEGLKASEAVSVYSVAGIVLLHTSACADGSATIDTSVLPVGMYIIRTNSATIKISNK